MHDLGIEPGAVARGPPISDFHNVPKGDRRDVCRDEIPTELPVVRERKKKKKREGANEKEVV